VALLPEYRHSFILQLVFNKDLPSISLNPQLIASINRKDPKGALFLNAASEPHLGSEMDIKY